MQKISIFTSFFCFLMFFSCTKDETAPAPLGCDAQVGYEEQIKPILETSCTYSSCHDGSGATDYSSYEKLLVSIENGSFTNRVITTDDMPGLYAVAPNPTELTALELEMITTWIGSGYPETASQANVNYDGVIGDIVIASCAYVGCHDGSSDAGPWDYNNYQGMTKHINDGSFENRVVSIRDNPTLGMPPSERVPDGKPKNLTLEEFELMLCWIEQGYPEN